MKDTDKFFLKLKELQNDFGPVTINLVELSRRLQKSELGMRAMLNSLRRQGKIKFERKGHLTVIDFL